MLKAKLITVKKLHFFYFKYIDLDTILWSNKVFYNVLLTLADTSLMTEFCIFNTK